MRLPAGLRLVSVALLTAGCAAPQTQLGSVSQDQVAIEAARQQQFALELSLKQQHRLQNVAIPLLEAAAPFCGDRVRGASGYIAANAFRWKNDYYNAARSAGFTDTLVVLNVAPGSAAAQAGLAAGDRILAINNTPILVGQSAIDDLGAKLPTTKTNHPKPYQLTYRRGNDVGMLDIEPHVACAYTPIVTNEDVVNAYADGNSIYITTGIMRFLQDDNDLAVVVGHEIAHDAMGHIDAKMKNSLLGALIGAVVDVAAATQGVNTDFARQGAELGAMVFSQDFEREADYVGLYILTIGGRPIDHAADVWRLMGASNPKEIKFASSHPTTAERFVRLDTWRTEIGNKVAVGKPLQPEMKNGKTFLMDGPSVRAVAAAIKTAPGSTISTLAPRTTDRPSSRSLTAPDELAAPVEPKPTKRDAPPSKRENPPAVESRADRGAHAVIGAPTSESARLSAPNKFVEAQGYLGAHKWQQAEAAFRETLSLDGSIPEYHAALGKLLMQLKRYDEAEAEFTAATLLDLDNAVYRKLVKEARSKR